MGTVGSSGCQPPSNTANTNKHLCTPVPSFPQGLIRLFCLGFHRCSSLSLGVFRKNTKSPHPLQTTLLFKDLSGHGVTLRISWSFLELCYRGRNYPVLPWSRSYEPGTVLRARNRAAGLCCLGSASLGTCGMVGSRCQHAWPEECWENWKAFITAGCVWEGMTAGEWLWLSGMRGRFALDLDRNHYISWRLRKNKREREGEREFLPPGPEHSSSTGHWTSKSQLAWSWDSGFGSVVPGFSSHWWRLRMMPSASLALVLKPFPREHPLPACQRACPGTSQPPWAHQPIVLMK